MRKKVLIAGASGLVGYAAIRHFAGTADCDIVALSRRAPDNAHRARFVPLDLTDAKACEQFAADQSDVTHLVYAALHELPGLVAGWREREQIETNDKMLRNLLDPLERHAKGLCHVTLLQGTKAYGVHVRPLKVPARENRSEMHEQAKAVVEQSHAQLGQSQHSVLTLDPLTAQREGRVRASLLCPSLPCPPPRRRVS